MRITTLILLVLILHSCDQKSKDLTVQDIIDRTIKNACNGNCDQAIIEFTFRDRCYISKRNNGEYQFERITIDSFGITRDVLTNSDFNRFRNDTLLKIPDSMAVKYGNSVNSVHYFAQLPYGLNDAAVQKEILGEDTINDEIYYEIGVSFNKDGGGDDYEDKFVYWVHKKNFTVDYLAYRYSDSGGGIRFREAYNVRNVEGIRFVDYNNYKPIHLDTELTILDDLFTEGKLKLLSKIENESVMVKLNSKSLIDR